MNADEQRGGRMSLPSVVRRLLADDKVRFLLVGGVNTAIGFLAFVAFDLTIGRMLDRGGHSVLASIVVLLSAHVVASIFAFYLYRRFVFKVTGNVLIDFVRFQGVYAVSLAINLLILPVLVELGIPRILAQACIIVVTTVVSYVGHRYFSFRRRASGLPEKDPLADAFVHDDPADPRSETP